MIFDNIKNCEMYYGLNKGFKAAFDFIKKATEEDLPVGKYEIDGTEVYGLVQEYTAKTPENCKIEAHKNYIDIQYVVSGIEVITSFDISKAAATSDYNPEKDIQFYEYNKNSADCTVEAGEYLILFPNDVHRPGKEVEGNPVPVKKIVVKVKL